MDDKINKIEELENHIKSEMEKHPRSATLLNLGWLAEKIKKQLKLKEKIEHGDYSVSSESIAKALADD